jgi:PAS domain S-box-containing protein
MKEGTILVAERDKNAIDVIRKVARKLGYRCIVVSSASALLTEASRSRPATAIVAARLKTRADGFAAARELRVRLDLPVICIGDKTVPPSTVRQARTELFGFLPKPLDRRQLQANLCSALECDKLESTLRSHAQWHREMLDCMSDGLLAIDHEGRVVFVNPAAENLTGLVAKDAVGRSLAAVLRESGMGKQAGASVADVLRKGASHAIGKQVVLRGKDGKECHVDISASPIRYASGDTAGVVLVLRDISERQTMTKRMLTEQKMKAVGTLARGIAHDFSAIIGTIGVHASSMVDSLISETRAHEDAVRIADATKRARELVNRLLSLARVSEPPVRQTPKPISVAATITAAANLFHGTFKEKNIVFSAKGPEPAPYIKGHGDHLMDALICLFLNSTDAMTKGGSITVGVSVRKIAKPNLKLNPRARRGSYVIISVGDTGSGMSRRVLTRLFEPFFTTKQTPAARGLGLTVVRTTVERWGGWVTVQSQPGRGTTFDLHIPEARVKHAAPESAPAKGGTILVIDNKATDLSIFRGILEDAGYKVLGATTTRKGVVLYKKSVRNIAATIIDLIMDDHDGKVAYKAIRKHNPEANIVMTSGFSRDYLRSHLGAGGWGFVQKPIEKNPLLEAIGRMINRKPETVLALQSNTAGTERRQP